MKGTLTRQNRCCCHEPWLSGRLSLLRSERGRKLHTCKDRGEEQREGEIKAVLGISEQNAPVAS